MIRKLKLYTGLIGLIAALISPPLLAERSLQIGLATSANNSFYSGVDEEHYIFPLVIAEYDRFYLKGTHGGYRLLQDKEGQSLALEFRRTFDGFSSKDSNALMGLADRNGAWEAGLAYERNLAGGQVKAKLLHDISNNHNGFSSRLEYERPLLINEPHMVTWYAGAEYWNSKKTNYYFGVTREEQTSVRSTYAADESYSLFLGSNALKRISKKITLIVSAEYLWMTDVVDDSPLTTRQEQYSAYAGIFYQF